MNANDDSQPPRSADDLDKTMGVRSRIRSKTLLVAVAGVIGVLAIAISWATGGSGSKTSADSFVVEPSPVIETTLPEAELTRPAEESTFPIVDATLPAAEPASTLPPTSDESVTPAAGLEFTGEWIHNPDDLATYESWSTPSFFLPASTDLSLIPLSAEDYQGEARCTADQIRWIRDNGGYPMVWSWTIGIRNDATDGGAMSLTNFRFEAENYQSEPMIMLTCGYSEMGAGSSFGQSLIMSHGEYAVNGPDYVGIGRPENEVTVINISPGQNEQLAFEWPDVFELETEMRGRLVADLILPSEATVTISEELYITPYVWDFEVQVAHRFWCSSPSLGIRVDCDLEVALEVMAEAAGQW